MSDAGNAAAHALTCRSFGLGGRAGGLASIGGRRFCWRSVTGARTFGVKALGGSPASRVFPGAFASLTTASDARSLTSALGRWSPSGCFSAGGTRLVRRRGRRSVTCIRKSKVVPMHRTSRWCRRESRGSPSKHRDACGESALYLFWLRVGVR